MSLLILSYPVCMMTAIIEVGIGGEYDCTNFVKEPAVVGITSLALDHVELLGTTIAQIAWQKAGIMKKNVNAFTVHQDPDALSVLQNRATEKGCKLCIVPHFSEYQLHRGSDQPVSHQNGNSGDSMETIVLGIPGVVQQVQQFIDI